MEKCSLQSWFVSCVFYIMQECGHIAHGNQVQPPSTRPLSIVVVRSTVDKMISLFLKVRLWVGRKRFGSLGPSVVRVSRARIIKGPCESVELVRPELCCSAHLYTRAEGPSSLSYRRASLHRDGFCPRGHSPSYMVWRYIISR